MSYRKLWIALGLVLVISFAVLGGVGIKVLKSAPSAWCSATSRASAITA